MNDIEFLIREMQLTYVEALELMEEARRRRVDKVNDAQSGLPPTWTQLVDTPGGTKTHALQNL